MFVLAHDALADEGGVSFWLPGQMGSFAATPSDPGWSMPLVYYRAYAHAEAGESFAIGGRLTAGLKTRSDLIIASPTYVFSTPLASGQASVGISALLGRVTVDVDATLTRPGGSLQSGALGDAMTGVGDLYPTASLKWDRGIHNWMLYTMAGVPAGAYEKGRLANVGANHWSLDAGGGYTFFDAKTGHEVSAVLGFTENWRNSATDYKNGVDGHLDWAASQFLSEQWHVGLAGYFYQQLTGDSGSGARLGAFKSRVTGIGPQAGYFFKVGTRQWYANFKVVDEINARNRPSGWNAWLTVAIPLGQATQ